MICEIYNLPDITLIGGDSFPIYFDLFRDRNKSIPFEMESGFTAYFSMIPYLNKDYAESPIYFASNVSDARVSIGADSDGIINNIIVQFKASDTVDLQGKFIYQITLIDSEGRGEVIGQGTMTIVRNIHPKLISK